MIDAHIIGFALLALKKIQPLQDFSWKPTKQDVLALRAELSQYDPKVINGRKQYPFEQHLVRKGICSFTDRGQLAVISPELYKRENDIYGLSQWMQEKDQEQLFQAYPEERVAWEQKIRAMFSSIKSVNKAA